MTLTVPHTHKLWSQTVTGYRINGLWSVVVPVGADVTNLCTNPSFETNTTMWSATGGASIARTATRQRRGAFSLQITPGAGAFDGAFCAATSVIGRQRYTWAVDFLGQAGQVYRIFVANTTGNAQSQFKVFTATGLWQRISISYQDMFTAGVTVARRLYVTKNGGANTGVFYIDGSTFYNLPYEITYFDGDSRGFSPTAIEFWWNGTSHGSTSTMSGKTRACGRKVPLTQYGFTVLAMLGLGMEPVNLITSPLAQRGGEQFIDAVPDARVFDLIGAFNARSLPQLQRQRQQMIDAFKIDSTPYAQPLVLRYTPVDDRGRVIGAEQEIVASYQSGLEGKLDNHYQENVDLRFKVYLPFIGFDDQSEGAALGVQQSIGNANRIMVRSPLGQWAALRTGANSDVEIILVASDGKIWAGGTFTLMGAVANTVRIAYFDPATGLWNAVGTGASSGRVSGLAEMPNGSIVAVGTFASMGGVANTNGAALWNGSAWVSMGNLVPAPTKRIVVTVTANGTVYATAGVASNILRLWTGGPAFTNIATTGETAGIVVGKDGLIYFGNGANITKYDGTTQTNIGALTGGTTVALSLAVADDGMIFLIGDFTAIAGVSASRIAQWNGASWTALGSGLGSTPDTGLTVEPRTGLLHVGGGNSKIFGGLTMPDGYGIWNRSSWVFTDIDLPTGVANVHAIAFAKDGSLYLGWDTSGNAAAPVVTVLTNTGSNKAYPVLTMIGPGTAYRFENYTTGKIIFLKMTLNAGEIATLDLSDPRNVRFYSNFRPNLLGSILPGSDLDFFLLPSINNISLFINGGTAATAASIYWRKAQHSIDSAIPVP